jgi:hypothetical protein
MDAYFMQLGFALYGIFACNSLEKTSDTTDNNAAHHFLERKRDRMSFSEL